MLFGALRQCFGAVLQASSRLLKDITTRAVDPAMLRDLPFSEFSLERPYPPHDALFLP